MPKGEPLRWRFEVAGGMPIVGAEWRLYVTDIGEPFRPANCTEFRSRFPLLWIADDLRAAVLDWARRQEERWQRSKADAIALKAARPELVVNLPALLLNEEAGAFVEQFARMAERGDEFTAPHIARGAVFYATIHGRLHRVIVEDLEPDIRWLEDAAVRDALSRDLQKVLERSPPPADATAEAGQEVLATMTLGADAFAPKEEAAPRPFPSRFKVSANVYRKGMEAALAQFQREAFARPVCATCNDTHVMPYTTNSGDATTVMCTGCPLPCLACRERGPAKAGGPFCATTPCPCDCHPVLGLTPPLFLRLDEKSPVTQKNPIDLKWEDGILVSAVACAIDLTSRVDVAFIEDSVGTKVRWEIDRVDVRAGDDIYLAGETPACDAEGRTIFVDGTKLAVSIERRYRR